MTEIKTGLCVLITNAFIKDWTGSELYVRDVAFELINRGHKPIVYSPRIGDLAEVLRRKSIPVVNDLNSIHVKPDIIHGQHHLETMTALSHFPETPAVFFCHGWLPWEETPPIHPRIIQYVTVSDALRDRLVFECGILAEKITTILNSVDLDRFRPRPPLPTLPKRALVFNSQANETNIVGIVRDACSQNGIAVDVLGYGIGNPSFDPETQLGNYDIVFAVGRAALESLAIGTTVICCGPEGASQMVSTQNLDRLRRNNFGIRILNKPLNVDFLSAEIKHYDPLDAQKVSQEIRATAGLSGMIDQVTNVYTTTLNNWAQKSSHDHIAESLAYSAYLKGLSGKVDQVIAESNFVQERSRILQSDEVCLAIAESNLAQDRARVLQDELDVIRGSLTWRLHQKIHRISFVHNLYLILISPIRR